MVPFAVLDRLELVTSALPTTKPREASALLVRDDPVHARTAETQPHAPLETEVVAQDVRRWVAATSPCSARRCSKRKVRHARQYTERSLVMNTNCHFVSYFDVCLESRPEQDSSVDRKAEVRLLGLRSLLRYAFILKSC